MGPSTAADELSSSGGYDPSLFDELARVEDRHFWFRARNRLIFDLARRISSRLRPGYMVLEVGCGTGNVLTVLRQACPDGVVVGLERWFDGLRHAQKRSAGPLVQGDVCSYPFGKRFDLIGMFDVLEHIPAERETLAALHEALVPGGKLLITVPAHQFLWSHFDEAAHHCRRYSEPELRTRLTEAGFEVEFLSLFMASIFPAVWIFRTLGRFSRENNPDIQKKLALREFRVLPVVNELLAALLNLEAQWVANGRTLPMGTSLIAIARRAA